MLWHHYLFQQLVRRELRRKYKGSSLGVLWYVINPLVLMGAYTLMFGHVFKLQTIPDFPIFLMIGLVVWTVFQQSLLAAAESLIDQGGLVRKARIERGQRVVLEHVRDPQLVAARRRIDADACAARQPLIPAAQGEHRPVGVLERVVDLVRGAGDHQPGRQRQAASPAPARAPPVPR